MSLLVPERRQITAPWQGWTVGLDYKTGKADIETLMGVAAAWSCAVLLADVVSMLPVRQRRRTDDDLTETVDRVEIVRNPSELFTRREWLFQAVVSGAVFGNVIGQVRLTETDRRYAGIPRVVEWLNPSTVDIRQAGQMSRPEYWVDGQQLTRSSVVHLRRYPMVGKAEAMSPLDRHSKLVGVAAAARDFASDWFDNGGHPSALLTTEQELSEEQAKVAKKRWIASGTKREPRVLGNGWKYNQVSSTPADSELKDTWDRVAADVCQVFRVPPEMIGAASSGSSVTYANREQRSIDFLTFTIEPWLTMFEDWWNSLLPEGEFVKFNPDALLRVDTLTRYRVHDVAVRMGKNSINEIRRLEDEPPIEGGDEYLWPPYRGFPVASDQE